MFTGVRDSPTARYSTAVNLSSVKSGAVYIVVHRLYYTLANPILLPLNCLASRSRFMKIHLSPELSGYDSRGFYRLTLVQGNYPRTVSVVIWNANFGSQLHFPMCTTLRCTRPLSKRSRVNSFSFSVEHDGNFEIDFIWLSLEVSTSGIALGTD